MRVDQYDLYNKTILILPGSGIPGVPRDYYFENMTTSSSQAILVDNAKGTVRIWLANVTTGNKQGDNLSGTIMFTSQDPTTFRLYDAKSSDLALGGSTVMPFGGERIRGAF